MFDVSTTKFTEFFRDQFLGFGLFILRLEVCVLLTSLASKLDDFSHGEICFF